LEGSNSQIGVFLGYACAAGRALLDVRLYLPRSAMSVMISRFMARFSTASSPFQHPRAGSPIGRGAG
jgi:hypothetical protein